MSALSTCRLILLCLIFTVANGSIADAAHERAVPLLLQKIHQSGSTAQQGIQAQNRRQIERGLGNVYVQAMSAMVQVRAEQNQFRAPGQIVDITQANWPFNNPNDAMAQMINVVGQAQQTYPAGDLKATTDHLFWILAAAEFAWFQSLQNGSVNPNGATLAGVGAFIELDGDKAYMAGTIDSRIRSRVSQLLSQRNIRTLVMVNVPGSVDDASNTAAALQINQAGMQTHLPNGGSVESGGTDFFLAGAGRSVSQNFNIGVHSWAGGGTSGFQLRNNRQNNNHVVPFLNYYRQIGMQDSFYFFTIGFRPEDMHYMTLAEVKQFGVLKQGGLTPPGPNPPPPGPMPPGPTPPRQDKGIAGTWTEVRPDGRSKTITIEKSGAFTEIGFDGSAFRGTASLNNNRLELRGNDGSAERLTVQMQQDRINFPGRSFHWARKVSTPGPFNIAGNWTEVRTDGRNKQIRMTDEEFQEFRNGRLTFSGLFRLEGNKLTLMGNDNSQETFVIKPTQNGRQIDFSDAQSGTRIRRFHWVR